MLISGDFSQLEICVQAWLSQDEYLIKDLNSGIDMHCKRLAFKVKKSYDEVFKLCKVDEIHEWVQKRKTTKAFSFQRAYGATAYSISQALDCPVEEIQALEKADLEMYPTLAEYNLQNQKLVEKQGYYTNPFGRRFYFNKLDKPWYYEEYKGNCWYAPTKVKNYIVQGTASDIVLIALGQLWRKSLKYRDKWLIINTVHDSVILDCRKEYIEECNIFVKNVLEDVVFYIQKVYNVSINVPIKVDVSEGLSWYDL
jgi:DNA polymerase-1